MIALSSIEPRQRSIVAVDIEQSTDANNVTKAWHRNGMYELFERALLDSGITHDLREQYDRGDGVMALVHPSDRVPKTRLLDTFAPTLSELLEAHNNCQRHTFRLRVAIHAGDVHFDQRGTFGEDIDVTIRLLDHPGLKARLDQTSASLVLVVSEHIHRSVIRHGYDGIDVGSFEPLVRLEVADLTYLGWVQVPAEARTSGQLTRIDRVS